MPGKLWALAPEMHLPWCACAKNTDGPIDERASSRAGSPTPCDMTIRGESYARPHRPPASPMRSPRRNAQPSCPCLPVLRKHAHVVTCLAEPVDASPTCTPPPPDARQRARDDRDAHGRPASQPAWSAATAVPVENRRAKSVLAPSASVARTAASASRFSVAAASARTSPAAAVAPLRRSAKNGSVK